ncbi:carbohydrate ABC transporter membrane protein 1 (CUT1 family) [Martelella mediterranea]|uniref:Carbohydrate ABC transporter membrane protein 1 (CUT1 family) n=2 Tax=Martelella mediterranea TaxID=293089 RepID=A0A4R3NTA3_9HYPH|nr:carbohydrate ABC transporter membrane protein 1 (CUT1 family) [Martelella mediterranea]
MSYLRPTPRGLWISCLILPGLAVMILFVAYPIVSALAYAFYDWNGLARGEFVGFQNFTDVLFREPYQSTVRNAFINNVIVFFTLMFVQNGAAFFLAYALWREFPLARFHRIAVFLPVVLSTVIVGYLWKLFLNPLFGIVNQTLKMVGLSAWAQPWLGQADTALGSLILVNAWHWVGFPTLIFLAAMQRIPSELYDAARMETESEWVKIRRIIWPLVAPAATIVFVLQFIGSFNWFELPYVMEDLLGSPYGNTDVLALYFYRLAFGSPSTGVADFGHGSALAALVFIFITVFATAMTLFLRRREIEL